ncbi:MAG: SMP-30/gluconolactonase/LRE family protein [Bacteroidota bacterium]
MNVRFTLCLMLVCMQIFQAQGQMVSTLVEDANREFEAIHWHADGRIIAVDYNKGRIYRISTNGTIQNAVSSGFTNLAGGGFDQDGNFYFADIWNGKLMRLNSGAGYTEVASGLSDPVGVVQSPDSDILYVAQYSSTKIKSVSRSTGQSSDWSTGSGINGPDGIIYLDDDTLLIANYNNSKIHKVDPEGNVMPFATVGSGNLGYITKAGSYVYAASISGKKIYRIDTAGNVTEFAGTGAEGYDDGPASEATFTSPNGICSSPTGDTILVADNNRIRMITGVTTGISRGQIELVHALTLSPNPTNGLLQVTFKGGQYTHLEWTILNQLGQVQANGSFARIQAGENQLQVPVQALAAGMYTFQLKDERGEAQSVSFVKKE